MRRWFTWAAPLVGLLITEVYRDELDWLRQSGYYPWVQFAFSVWVLFLVVDSLPVSTSTRLAKPYKVISTFLVASLCGLVWWLLMIRHAPNSVPEVPPPPFTLPDGPARPDPPPASEPVPPTSPRAESEPSTLPTEDAKKLNEPKSVPIFAVYESGTLPIPIEPHENLYVLRLHPDAAKERGLLRLVGTQIRRLWPPADFTPNEMIKTCTYTNRSTFTLLSAKVTFRVIYANRDERTDVPAVHTEHQVNIGPLAPGDHFTFVLVNVSNERLAIVNWPIYVTVRLQGEQSEGLVAIQKVTRNKLDELPGWPLPNSQIDWSSVLGPSEIY